MIVLIPEISNHSSYMYMQNFSHVREFTTGKICFPFFFIHRAWPDVNEEEDTLSIKEDIKVLQLWKASPKPKPIFIYRV